MTSSSEDFLNILLCEKESYIENRKHELLRKTRDKHQSTHESK